MKNSVKRTALCALAAILAMPAAADVYTIVVNGVVTEVRNSRGQLPAALATAQVGQYFSMRYFIQDGMADADASPNRGQYVEALFDIPEQNLYVTVTVNGQNFALPSPTGAGQNDRSHYALDNVTVGSTNLIRDQLSYQKVSCANGTTACFNIVVLTYADSVTGQPPPTALTSDQFFAAPVNLNDFAVRTMRFHAGSATNVRNQTSVDSIIGTIQNVSVSSGIMPPPAPPSTYSKDPTCPCTCPRG